MVSDGSPLRDGDLTFASFLVPCGGARNAVRGSPVRDASTRFSTALRYRDGEHPAQTWFTPSYVLDPAEVSARLDPCTTQDNPVEAEEFYTVADDGLAQPWFHLDLRTGAEWLPTIFVNPPYSRAREPWVEPGHAARRSFS